VQADLRYINRDAAALLLHRSPAPGGGGDSGSSAAWLDLRRHDERTLYGSIPGSHHIPGATAVICDLFCQTPTASGVANQGPSRLARGEDLIQTCAQAATVTLCV